ncbi:MAG: hypothetical protein ABSG53_08230 [Thermoguttaceae bacterium]|jgi:hypothetical protein
MKFQLGQIVATPAALKAIEEAGQDPAFFLDKHIAGDWGEVDKNDSRAFSLFRGLRANEQKLLTLTDSERQCDSERGEGLAY